MRAAEGLLEVVAEDLQERVAGGSLAREEDFLERVGDFLKGVPVDLLALVAESLVKLA